MDTLKLEFKKEDCENYRDKLLGYLKGQVFHVTTQKAHEQIVKDSFISHNQNKKFPLNCASQKSYGRLNGFVCLFDLRGKSDDTIKETLAKYNFLAPSWFEEIHKDYAVHKLAYLIYASEYFDEIVFFSSSEASWVKLVNACLASSKPFCILIQDW